MKEMPLTNQMNKYAHVPVHNGNICIYKNKDSFCFWFFAVKLIAAKLKRNFCTIQYANEQQMAFQWK